MNKRASVLLALLMSCSSLIWRRNAKPTVELNEKIYGPVETHNFYKITCQLKINATEKLRVYLKAELGIKDEEPKKLYQLSFFELVNKVNPWGYTSPVDICNDNIICLVKLLVIQKYEKFMTFTINSAGNYGFKLSIDKVIFLIICGLWILKKLTGFLLPMAKNLIKIVTCGISNNIRTLFSISCVLVKISSNKMQKLLIKMKQSIALTFSKMMNSSEKVTLCGNEIKIENGLKVLESKQVKVSDHVRKVCKPSKIPKWDGIKVGSKDHEVAHYIYVYAETLGSKIPRLNALKEKLY